MTLFSMSVLLCARGRNCKQTMQMSCWGENLLPVCDLIDLALSLCRFSCRHNDYKVASPALRAVGNIVTGDDIQTQVRDVPVSQGTGRFFLLRLFLLFGRCWSACFILCPAPALNLTLVISLLLSFSKGDSELFSPALSPSPIK